MNTHHKLSFSTSDIFGCAVWILVEEVNALNSSSDARNRQPENITYMWSNHENYSNPEIVQIMTWLYSFEPSFPTDSKIRNFIFGAQLTKLQ